MTSLMIMGIKDSQCTPISPMMISLSIKTLKLYFLTSPFVKCAPKQNDLLCALHFSIRYQYFEFYLDMKFELIYFLIN